MLIAAVGVPSSICRTPLRLGIGWGTDGPQSGFFPFWLAVIMVARLRAIVAAGVCAGASRRRRSSPATQLRPGR